MALGLPRSSTAAHPPSLHPAYTSTVLRAPREPLILVPHTLTELTGPVYGHGKVRDSDADLTTQHAGEPLGERIIVSGRVLDEDGRYSFTTVRPGAYPWRNHHNAWRPAHIHFSVFGPSFLSRLVTQMYFPGDPLFPYDPIFNGIPDPKARERLIARFDLETTKPEWALGYQFDIVLRGREATPMEEPHEH